MTSIFGRYLQIIKPGIVIGNMISVVGGFLLATKGNINYCLLVTTVMGVALIIASSCVLNNYIDVNIDKKMKRTKNRVLVNGLISNFSSLLYSISLGITGFLLLFFGNNLLVFNLGVLGYIIYVFIYSLYVKYNSIYSTVIGSFAGAMPPIIGYCAVTNKFDIGSIIVLVIFILWQIPHFYSIVINHFKDYQVAKIKTFPTVKGIVSTKKRIILYIIAFSISILMLPFNNYIKYKYILIVEITSFWWFVVALYSYKNDKNKIWTHRLFITSIVTIMSLSLSVFISYCNEYIFI